MRFPRLIGDYRDLVTTVEDWSTLGIGTEDVARELGFEFVAVLHTPSLIRRSKRYIRHDNYPMGWDRRLVSRGHKIIDPILSIARRRTSGFLWSDALTKARLSDLGSGPIKLLAQLLVG